MVRTALAVLLTFSLLSCSPRHSVSLQVPRTLPVFQNYGKSASPVSYYRFTRSQLKRIASFADQAGSAALDIELTVRDVPAVHQTAAAHLVGFISDRDFDSSGVLRHIPEGRPVVTGILSTFSGSSVRIVFCFSRTFGIPAGFYISGPSCWTITQTHIIPSEIGFDYTGHVPVFAFSPSGGTLSGSHPTVDFTGARHLFMKEQQGRGLYPDIQITVRPAADPVIVSFNGEEVKIRSSGEKENPFVIPAGSLNNAFGPVSGAESGDRIAALMMRPSDPALSDPGIPVPVDPGLISLWNKERWRRPDFELYAWDRFPYILVFDTADYRIQDDLFRRLAFFVEKAGYRGQLLSDQELSGKHGYNAHDYSADSLARFFAAAAEKKFPLNSRECELQEILIRQGIIIRHSSGSITAGKGAVISISQESAPELRTTFIAHEGWHGLYFTDADFRNAVASVYYTIDQPTLDFLITYFSITPTLNYDVHDEDLMKNEFMAYMLQRSLSQTARYYVNMASRDHAQWGEKKQADYIIKTQAAGFVSAATLLDSYVASRWGLAAGRIWLISR
jgi:hypothetical protein